MWVKTTEGDRVNCSKVTVYRTEHDPETGTKIIGYAGDKEVSVLATIPPSDAHDARARIINKELVLCP